ncbi:MAG TPA: carbohydrate-binding protein, partial [Tepidisphaeraceae bacterium]
NTVVTRLTSTGDYDKTFGNGGSFTLNAAFDQDGTSVLAQPDGKVVVVTSITDSEKSGVKISRFDAAGVRDVSFGTGGDTFIGTTAHFYPVSMVGFASGKIMLSGSDGRANVTLMRLNPNGIPDSTFGTAGLLEQAMTNAAGEIIPLPNDVFYLAGRFSPSSSSLSMQALLAKFTSSGTLDKSFANGVGFYQGPLGTSFASAEIQQDGKIVASGGIGNYLATRFLTSGVVDKTFGSNGSVSTDIQNFDVAIASALAPDDRLIVAGATDNSFEGALVRYTNDGWVIQRPAGLLEVTVPSSDLLTIQGVSNGLNLELADLGVPFASYHFAPGVTHVAVKASGLNSTSLLLSGVSSQWPGVVEAATGSTVNIFGGSGDDSIVVSDTELTMAATTVKYNQPNGIFLSTFGGSDSITELPGQGKIRRIESGTGNDSIIINALANTTTLDIDSGSGNDSVALSAQTAVHQLEGNIGTDKLIIVGSATADALVVKRDSITGGAAYVYSGFESLQLDAMGGDDVITVAADAVLPLLINGGDGTDTLDASAAAIAVAIDGGPGNDSVRGGNMPDTLQGGAGNDVFNVVGGGTDVVDGGSDNDLATSDPADQLVNVESNHSGMITGVVFNDLNGSQVQDAGELAVAGRTVYLDRDGNGHRDQGEEFSVTDSKGAYSFAGIGAGQLLVRQELPPGWVQTLPAAGAALALVMSNNSTVISNQLLGSRLAPVEPPQTSFGGTPIAITAGATIVIQVENFDLGGEGLAYHDSETANLGGKYRLTEGVDIETAGTGATGANVGYANAGEWLEYSINVIDGGSYTLSFNVASAADNGKFHLEVDGVNATGLLAMPNTGGWQSWKTVSKSGINLSAGQHVLRLAMDTNGSNGYAGNFDAFTLTGNPPLPTPGQQTPFGSVINVTQSASSTIEAEDFDNGGEGVAFHDVDATNNGGVYRAGLAVDQQGVSNDTGGYNVGWTAAGEWLEYTVNVESGTYDLAFRVASPGNGGTFHLEVDGLDVTGSITVPNTGGWQNWTTVTKSNVSLGAGTRILRLAMDANGSAGAVGNFNYLKVAPVVAPPPPGSQTPYKGVAFSITDTAATTIEIEDYDLGGEGVAYHDTGSSNQGGQYRTADGVDVEAVNGDTGAYNVGWASAGEWLEYSVDVAKAASYTADFRVASNGGGGTFHLEVDGVNVTGPMTVPNTSGWQNWTTITKSGINLPAGQHVLRLAMESVGATGAVGNFNSMKISGGAITPTPSGSTPFSVTPVSVNTGSIAIIQAEEFDNGGEGVAYHDLDNTNQGGKFRSTGVDIESVSGDSGSFNIGYARAGEWLKYSVNVLTGGTYTLDFRLASAASGGKFHLEVDGSDVTGQLALNSTGGWQSWQTISKSGVSLTAGQHVLRLVMDADSSSGYVGNFNYLSLR